MTALTEPTRALTPDLSYRQIDLPFEHARIDPTSPASDRIYYGPGLVLLFFVCHQSSKELRSVRRRQRPNPLCKVVNFGLRSLHRGVP